MTVDPVRTAGGAGGELDIQLFSASLPDPHVSIRRVSAIARDAATGKRRQIVPLDAVTHGSDP